MNKILDENTKFDFAKAINEVGEINQWFQSEDINLDEGLAKFRRGLELIKKCRIRLKQVENEFTEIKKEFDVNDKEIISSNEKEQIKNPNDSKRIDPNDIPF